MQNNQTKREIKFRAWKKFELGGDHMLVNTPNLMLDASHGIPYWQFGFEEPKPMADVILMQYTNLKDKNGKEIYEGDVVHYEYYYRGKDYWAVIWAYDRWVMRRGEREPGDESVRDDSPTIRWEESEVIGNIYSNPELLK